MLRKLGKEETSSEDSLSDNVSLFYPYHKSI